MVEAAFADVGMDIPPSGERLGRQREGRPATGRTPRPRKAGTTGAPFYIQTYMAFYGVDSSTLEMCDSEPAGCDGRFGSKRAQYVGFYSSADFWLQNRVDILHDQLEIFRRGVEDADRGELLRRSPGGRARVHRGPAQLDGGVSHGVPDPVHRSVVVHGPAKRRTTPNRMAQWLMDNGIRVHRTNGGRHLERTDVLPAGLLRRVDGPGPTRHRADRPERGTGRLRSDHPALRPARRGGATGPCGAPMSWRSPGATRRSIRRPSPPITPR